MVSELSILIPVYNQSVRTLVEALLAQVPSLTIPLEIRVYDDGSSSEYLQQNRELALLPGVVYKELPVNVGRSKIRIVLAQEAAHNWLLFLDNDVLPVHNLFLQNYISQTIQRVCVGGIAYHSTHLPQAKLRWKYGKNREQAPLADRQKNPYDRVFFSNLLVRKNVFHSYFSFAEIKGYGHEDSLFAYQLQEAQETIQHLDNPVYHLGLEDAATFLAKTEEAIKNLVHLQKTIPLAGKSKLIQTYLKAKEARVEKVLAWPASLLLPLLRRNLKSTHPLLPLFDLYKLLLYVRYKK